ncbi:MAG: DUF4349 domain-containing protein [Erysipelotrichaceae bacterium]|nr:DUF4349 domain-containing protein [Erysipelotrichaceae bacterium]
MKKSEKLADAIGMIDDRYIEEAHSKTKKKFKFDFSWATMGKIATAACALLLVINIFPVLFHSYSDKEAASDSYYSNSYYSYEAKDEGYLSAPASAGNAYYDGEYAMAEEAPMEMEAQETPAPLPGSNSQVDARQNKKLILTSYMNMETQDLDALLETVNPAISKYGGYVQRSSISNRGNSRYYEAVIRVPAENYTAFLEEVRASGNSTYYSEETKDITDSYTDIQARLTSLKTQEAKVLEFYDKAESIDDLMSIEARLSDIQYEIGYYEAQIKNYDLLVTYSTLNLNVTETKVYTPVSTSFFARLGRSFVNGFKNFIGGIEDFIIDVTYNIWTIILLIALGYGGYRLYRFIRNRKSR